jgi:L-amino acid N-acyltransferase YncA
LTAEAWPAVAAIYEAGIRAGDATFEERAPSWEEFAAKRTGPALLALAGESEEVLGWAAIAPVSSRCVYRGVGEISIYVAPQSAGRGVGRTLLDGLLAAALKAGFWTLEAGIFPENAASIALHERCGFRLVGTRERIGRMPDGRWRDVLLYEHRSASAQA